MKTRLILSAAIAIFGLASRLIAEEVKYPPINPALTYWQAAAEMPDLKGEKSGLLNDAIFGKKPLDDAKVKELLSNCESSLKAFARAALSPAPCDWGLAIQEGPEMILPHLSKMRELCLLAILKADALFAEGKPKEGIDWLLLADRASQHTGAGDVVISVLVQDSIESVIIYSTGQHCLGWDDAERKRYADGLKAMPPLHTLQDGFRGDAASIGWWERLLAANDTEKYQLFLIALGMQATPDPERERHAREIVGQFSGDNGKKMIEQIIDFNWRVQLVLGMSWKEGKDKFLALGKEAQQEGSLVALLFSHYNESFYAKQFHIATLRTMRDAALQYGPEIDERAAARFKDFFDGEPLVLKKGEDGSLTLTTARKYVKRGIELKLGK